jgi:hypothetical protein
MPVCVFQYLSNLHGDHLRLYLRNNTRIPFTDLQPIPRHNETLHGFGCLRSVRWRALILSTSDRTSAPVWPARRQCRAAWVAPLFLVSKELEKIVSHRTASFGIP